MDATSMEAQTKSVLLNLALGNIDVASVLVDGLRRQLPTSAEIALLDGLAGTLRSAPNRAAESFQAAQRLDPLIADKALAQGDQYLAAKIPGLARLYYVATLAMRPEAAAAHYGLGKAYVGLGQPRPAAESFRRFLTLDQTGTLAEDARRELARLE